MTLDAATAAFPVIIVSGLSGAGKSTALNVFEDIGFFSVEGLPPSLTAKLVELFKGDVRRQYRGLAVGLDLRRHDFAEAWSESSAELSRANVRPQVLFLEARTPVLVRRYATTRRPHPFDADGLGLEQAIEEEKRRLEHLRSEASLVLDTSDFSVHDLRRRLQEKWTVLADDSPRSTMRVHVITFGFKYGAPSEADMLFDLRFLPNPYFIESMRPLTGKNPEVADYVLQSEVGAEFMPTFTTFLLSLVPLFAKEGRYRLTIGIGCTGGRHRSVAVAEALVDALRKTEYAISLEHRHIEWG